MNRLTFCKRIAKNKDIIQEVKENEFVISDSFQSYIYDVLTKDRNYCTIHERQAKNVTKQNLKDVYEYLLKLLELDYTIGNYDNGDEYIELTSGAKRAMREVRMEFSKFVDDAPDYNHIVSLFFKGKYNEPKKFDNVTVIKNGELVY